MKDPLWAIGVLILVIAGLTLATVVGVLVGTVLSGS